MGEITIDLRLGFRIPEIRTNDQQFNWRPLKEAVGQIHGAILGNLMKALEERLRTIPSATGGMVELGDTEATHCLCHFSRRLSGTRSTIKFDSISQKRIPSANKYCLQATNLFETFLEGTEVGGHGTQFGVRDTNGRRLFKAVARDHTDHKILLSDHPLLP